MKNVIGAFDTIGESIKEDKEESDPSTILAMDELSFVASKLSAAEMNGSSVETKQGTVELPANFAQGYSCLESSVSCGIFPSYFDV